MDLFSVSPPKFLRGGDRIFTCYSSWKPLQVDLTMKNKTRPSCARVKVEVDLLGESPKRIKIGIKRGNGEVLEKWIRIKYDYIPKYCKRCKIQGHDEENCYMKHPKLYKKHENDAQSQEPSKDEEGTQPKEAPSKEKQQKEKGIEEWKKQEKFKQQNRRHGGRRQQIQNLWQGRNL